MKYKKYLIIIGLVLLTPTTQAKAYLEIDIKNEIDLMNGAYIAKEYGGMGRFALISHSHGRFSDGDIAAAECSDGYIVSNLPAKFNNIKKHLQANSFVFTNCSEDFGEGADKTQAQANAIKSNNQKQKGENKSTIDEIIKNNSQKISSLGFSNKFLKSKIYLRLDMTSPAKGVMTFESFIALLYANPRITKIDRISYGKFEGIRTKMAGFPSGGILFNLDDGDIFPSHMVSGDDAIRITTTEEMLQVSLAILRMMDY